MFRFLHAADLHIDSPLRGLERYEGAPKEQLRGATRSAFKNLIDLALEEEVSFILLAGDLYDGDWRDYNTGLFFATQMARLQEASIPAYIVYGNHDAQSRMTKNLRLPPNVHAFTTKKPGTFMIEDVGVAIHGQGFDTAEVTWDLTDAYPKVRTGYFNVGMLHTCAEGSEQHARYAPTTLDALASKGYDYWALGHVHKRSILRQDPWIVFPGNTQGRHIRETGSKGCTLVTVQDGQVVSAEHRSLDVLRWDMCRVQAAGAGSPSQVLDRISRALQQRAIEADAPLTAMRIEVVGPCRAHNELSADPDKWQSEIRALAADVTGRDLWLEKIKLQTSAEADLEDLLRREDALGDLLRSVHQMDQDRVALSELTDLFTELQVKLPIELRSGDDALDLKDPDTLKGALDDVRQILISRLIHVGST